MLKPKGCETMDNEKAQWVLRQKESREGFTEMSNICKTADRLILVGIVVLIACVVLQ